MKQALANPSLAALLILGCMALSACDRAEAPVGAEVSPAASEAASGAETTAAPAAPEASGPATEPSAAPEPPSSASPPSTSAAPADAAGGGTAATPAAAPSTDTATASAPSAEGAAAAQPTGGDGAGGAAPYKVVDGYKVDPATLEGFRTWRSAACDRCHGANQEGMVGPSLIESLKKLSKEEFATVVTEGRLAKGMPSFKTNSAVMKNMDQLYAYLKGRSDGAITQAKVEAM